MGYTGILVLYTESHMYLLKGDCTLKASGGSWGFRKSGVTQVSGFESLMFVSRAVPLWGYNLMFQICCRHIEPFW